MVLFSFEFMKYASYVLMGITLLYMLIRKIEVPAFFAFFFISAGINRYDAIVNKKTAGFVVVQNWDIFIMNNDIALEALNLMFIGTVLMSLMSILFLNKPRLINIRDAKELESKFIIKNKQYIYNFIIFYVIFVFLISKILPSALYLYSVIFVYAIGSVVVFSYFLLKADKGYQKNLVFSLTLLVAILVYDSFLRFTLLSWSIPLFILIISNLKLFPKVIMLMIGIPIGIIVFNLGGVLRTPGNSELPTPKLIELSITRAVNSEDANMLDGFMMAYQVFPNRIDYFYGIAHLEFFTRPIPRALWPGKPSGGYINKLGLNDQFKTFTIGISESIYGTFYGEFGVFGVVFFSMLYGFLFAKTYNYSYRYSNLIGVAIRGLGLSFAVIISRGGDIPGILANFILAYLPLYFFLRKYNAFLKKENLMRSYLTP